MKTLWKVPDSVPVGGPEQADVWRVFMPSLAAHRERIWAVLSPEERGQAAGKPRQRDQDVLLFARYALRSILALYTGFPAHLLRFVPAAHGKLRVADAAGARLPVTFDVATAEDWTLVVIAPTPALGVHLMRIRDGLQADDASVLQLLSRRERRLVEAAAATYRPALLHALCVRKTAYSRAATPLQGAAPSAFSIPAQTETPLRLRVRRPAAADHVPPAPWWLFAPEVARPYAAAVVAPVANFETLQWTIDCLNLPSRLP